MTAYLLDVNVLVALSWPGHKFHDLIQDWFARNAPKGWATCPMVQAGFVRIVSNPAFSPKAVSPKDAIAALRFNTSHTAHQFWPDDVSVATGMANLENRILGHQQVTDAYLVELAVHHRGKLATMDQGIRSWGPASVIELIK